MIRIRAILAAAAVAGPALMGSVVPSAAAPGDRCLTGPEMQTKISSGQILSWASIREIAKIPKSQLALDIKVCLRGGVPYYVVQLSSSKGDYGTKTFNALDGSS